MTQPKDKDNKKLREHVLNLMRNHHIPQGSDDPAVQELGAPQLHYLDEETDK